MALKVKPGVTFTFAPAGFRILEALKRVSGELGVDLTITSGSDGVHSGPKDPHKLGEAYDIRSKDLSPANKTALVDRLRVHLGSQFFVFLEVPGTDNEHVHAQRRKNTLYTILDYLKA